MNTAIKQDYAPTWLQHEPTHPSIALLAADNEPYNDAHKDSDWAIDLCLGLFIGIGAIHLTAYVVDLLNRAAVDYVLQGFGL